MDYHEDSLMANIPWPKLEKRFLRINTHVLAYNQAHIVMVNSGITFTGFEGSALWDPDTLASNAAEAFAGEPYYSEFSDPLIYTATLFPENWPKWQDAISQVFNLYYGELPTYRDHTSFAAAWRSIPALLSPRLRFWAGLSMRISNLAHQHFAAKNHEIIWGVDTRGRPIE